MGLLLLLIGIAVIVWLIVKPHNTITCDHCGFKFAIANSKYNGWATSGKKCPKCKNCVNKD